MPRSTSQNLCCQCPCPRGEPQPPPASAGDPPTLAGRSEVAVAHHGDKDTEPQPPPASAGDPPTLAGRSGSVSYGVTAPSPSVLMHTSVCPPRVESLFPLVLSKSCSQIPLAFKV